MQQRVALARALVNLPKVLLLDEPLGALDLKLRKGLQVELKRIQREVGITFVYVTHDQEEALTMSDRIAVMNHGRYEQVAPARRGLRAPDDHLRRRVHRRLQPDAGDRRREVGRARRRCASTPGSRSRPPSTASRSGDRCHAVVRPEKLRIDANGAGPPDGWPVGAGRDRELRLPRHRDPDRRRARRRRADDRARARTPSESERERLPGGGAPRAAELGARAHAHRPRVRAGRHERARAGSRSPWRWRWR